MHPLTKIVLSCGAFLFLSLLIAFAVVGNGSDGGEAKSVDCRDAGGNTLYKGKVTRFKIIDEDIIKFGNTTLINASCKITTD